MNLPMTIEEIKKKIKNEVPIQTIADLNGLDIKTFEKVIRQYEEESGKKILPQRKRGRPKTETPARSTRYRRAAEEKAKEPKPIVAKIVPVEVKIEVDENTFREVERRLYAINERIEGLKKDISYYEDQIESWQKILASIKKKEAPKNDKAT